MKEKNYWEMYSKIEKRFCQLDFCQSDVYEKDVYEK